MACVRALELCESCKLAQGLLVKLALRKLHRSSNLMFQQSSAWGTTLPTALVRTSCNVRAGAATQSPRRES